jgi:hypothetical protein
LISQSDYSHLYLNTPIIASWMYLVCSNFWMLGWSW